MPPLPTATYTRTHTGRGRSGKKGSANSGKTTIETTRLLWGAWDPRGSRDSFLPLYLFFLYYLSG